MKLIKAVSDDLDKIVSLYMNVANNTGNMSEFGRWIYGLYPTDDILKEYIDNGFMYFVEDDGDIIAAAAVTPFQGEDYHSAEWNVDVDDDEVSVVHLLCVAPDKQGCGIAGAVMNEIISISRKIGMKAVRLDALCCNTPAHRLYSSLGFRKCGVRNWYAANTDWIDFFLFELIL